MSVKQGWAENCGVRLHYLDSNPEPGPSHVPLLFIPGALEAAEDYQDELPQFAPRRCLAVSLRGRGQSDAPATNYSFNDHVDDIEAVIQQVGLTRLCLMAYSLGVPYALGYASRNPRCLAGLILGDFPARYPALPPEWVNRGLESFGERIKPHVIYGLQSDSAEIPLWDKLRVITCPVLIIRGGQSDTLLNSEMADRYRELWPRSSEIVVFEDSGHELWKPDYQRFINTLKAFLNRIE